MAGIDVVNIIRSKRMEKNKKEEELEENSLRQREAEISR